MYIFLHLVYLLPPFDAIWISMSIITNNSFLLYGSLATIHIESGLHMNDLRYTNRILIGWSYATTNMMLCI